MMEHLLFFPFLQVNQTKLQQQLTDKRILITGASYGIGARLADRLADIGAHLLLVARTAELNFAPNCPIRRSAKLTRKRSNSRCQGRRN